jgi:uncharacterized protein YraI
VIGIVTEPASAANNLWWVRIDTDYGTGWVAESFLTSADGGNPGTDCYFSPGDAVYVDTDGINLRTTASTSGGRVAVLYTNEKATVIDGPASADGFTWYKLESTKGTGWGVAQYLALGTTDPGSVSGFRPGDTVVVTTDAVSVRASAGLGGSRVTILTTRATATVLEGPRKADGYSWIKVKAGSNQGWAVSDYFGISASSGIAPGSNARVIDGELNLRAEPGANARVIGVLGDGATVNVIVGPRSAGGFTWVRVTSSRFGTGWCVTKYLEKA